MLTVDGKVKRGKRGRWIEGSPFVASISSLEGPSQDLDVCVCRGGGEGDDEHEYTSISRYLAFLMYISVGFLMIAIN
jgi:hypothetical protein